MQSLSANAGNPAFVELWLVLKAATVAILLAAAVAAWRQKHRAEAPFLAAVFVAIGLYRATTLWLLLPRLGLSPVAVLTFTQAAVAMIPPSLAAAIFIGNGRLTPSKRNITRLYAIPLITIGVTLTNPWHELMWANASFDAAWTGLVHPEWGLWFTLIFAPFSYGLILLTMLAAVVQLASPMRVFRQQALALLVAIGIPTAMNLWTTFGPGGAPPVVIESAFFLGSVVLSYGLVQFQLFRVPPIAHDAILASIGDGVLVIGADDHVVEANTSACTLLGIEGERSLGPLDRVLARHPVLVAQLRGPRPGPFAYVPGMGRELEIEIRPLSERGGRRAGRLVLLRDLSEQRRAESMLREREALLDGILQSSPNGILTVGPCGGEVGWPRDFVCLQANPAAIRFLGHDGPLVGTKLSEANLIHRALLMQVLRDTVVRGVTSAMVLDAPDEGRWYQVTSTPTGSAALVTVVDITDQKAREHEMSSMANLDPLTRLFNRRGFEADARTMLEQLAASGASVALFYFDLDGFKPANDRFGHAVGDAVLVEFGRRLRASFRDSALLARMGGDEFVVLMPEVAAGDVDAVAARVQATLSVPYEIDGVEIACPASVGSAWSLAGATDLDTLLDRADRRMLSSKWAARQTTALR